MYKKAQYLEVIERAKEKLAAMDAAARAELCGFKALGHDAAHKAKTGEVETVIEVPFLADVHTMLVPSLEMFRAGGRPASRILQAVVLHHLIEADETPLAGRFIPFREMPGLGPYLPTIKWRIFDVLTRSFGAEPERLYAALPGLGGQRLDFGDASAQFNALPRIPLHVVIWGADEIEPPSANMLFDESVTRLLPLEDIVVLGELTAHRLKAEAAGNRVKG